MSDLYERPVRKGIQDRCHSLLDGEGGNDSIDKCVNELVDVLH